MKRYALMLAYPWSALESPGRYIEMTDGPSGGFIPVFNTWAEADGWRKETEYPDAYIMEVTDAVS